ncbi:MAG: glutamate-5-semialdehyde dehydrogenase [Spirochaeta sp.]|nr:glutamate-5-semialdehyde dehydrogenase [Spirochaeta sp.]
MNNDIRAVAAAARDASRLLAAENTSRKNAALAAVAEHLEAEKQAILAANHKDMEAAEANGLAAPLLKRLRFDEAKLTEAIRGIHSVITLPDPVGLVQEVRELDEGLVLKRVGCPIGVIGMVFESRPDALVQIASLCLKSGNAVLLKGGSEARETNKALAAAISHGAESAGMPSGWIGLLETRQDVGVMLALDDDIDLIIPRGSNEFVKHIMDTTRIPVLGHADGICHVYVDAAADIDMALRIVADSKTQYVAVCINRYGSGHTDAIVTTHTETANLFMDRVDSASVMWNCSTRFADGFRYGLGAEVGISTVKVHARGPVGLEGLCTYKWRLRGAGHVVADYSGPHARPFTHRTIASAEADSI